MKVWLDDMRPAPDGWEWVKETGEAMILLLTGTVEIMSLDHDLGACPKCMEGYEDAEHWLDRHDYQSMPNCEHFGTGYTLLCWMEEHDVWPKTKPTVHSANPVGRKRMQVVIDKKFGPWL